MKATGIVRRVDDLGRIVIPKEIRRTLRIREGDPLLTALTPSDRYLESTPQPKGVEITAFSDKMCYNNCTGIM